MDARMEEQMKRRLSLISAAVIALALASLATLSLNARPVSADISPSWWNGWSGLCLNVQGANPNNGAKLIQWTCTNVPNESFSLTSCNGSGQCELVENNYNKCVTDPGASTSNGTQLQDWACTGATTQLWRYSWVDNFDVTLTNVYSGKCMEVYNWSKSNGGVVDQWTCLSPPTSHENQVWHV